MLEHQLTLARRKLLKPGDEVKGEGMRSVFKARRFRFMARCCSYVSLVFEPACVVVRL